jgi:hypothetical protein
MVKENHKKTACFKFEWDVLVGAPSRKLKALTANSQTSAQVSPQYVFETHMEGYVYSASSVNVDTRLRSI